MIAEFEIPCDGPQEDVRLTFMEEPLGIAASHGYGKATQLNRENKLRELEVLQRLSSPPGSYPKHCVRLDEHFYQPGVDAADGEHLCMAMELMCSSVSSIRHDKADIFIPVSVVKRMLRHLLSGIADIHSRGIAHTDIKPDNIMIDLGSSWTTESIDAWLKDNPAQAFPPTQSLYKMVTGYVSQSFPHPPLDTLNSHTYKLADFGSAQFVSDQMTDDITPLGLRPPEIILGGEWNESVDIWTFGCVAFNLLTGTPLFNPLTIMNQSREDTVLYQMICFCGEFFHEKYLGRCSRSTQYFDYDCRPKPEENKKFFRKTFQECILSAKFPIAPEDVEGAAALMARALRLDPRDRPTAQELLEDPWLAS
ncbi:hypothetical protein EW146_g7302 [Bondarzewia mesenterica]|uniref:non-specific serine/threonine protein kinase n=1 Tax=Bondarzewia mesenterica TaxID=1095465 RepID=A0A4S4LLP8_9AGAM|nr:hypothetical protein EW146_g7302 [Bondarzewia mesenterica]